MADITVESAAQTTLYKRVQRTGPVWTDKDTGYIFMLSSANILSYRKTTDAGATWGSAVAVGTGVIHLDIWFDKWTPGDSGTKIHIWWIDTNDHDIVYRNLDTSGDTLGSATVVFDGASFPTANRGTINISGTKAVGGNLYVQFWGDVNGERGFYRSTDSGANWTSRTDGADGDTEDDILCLPDADSADNEDIVMMYWDRSANQISIKKYDNSANGWAETIVAGSMAEVTSLLQMSATIRHSDGHIIFTAWSTVDSATADLKVWDITVATSTATVKTDVVTDSDDCITCALLIDQNNDDLYCAYLGNEDGSEIYLTSLTAYYKKSTDGGATWGSQTAYQVNTADDERYIDAGLSTPGAAAGRFMPVFFNDDLNDLFVNATNSVELGGAGAQTLTPSGIASLEAFGAATVTGDLQTITAGAIPSAEAFGSAQLNLTFTASGIASLEAFGNATVGQQIAAGGIASLEAFGSATISTGVVTLSPSGIPSAEAFGSAVLTTTVSISAGGITSAEAFGSAQLNLAFTASGIASAEAFGAATVTLAGQTLSPSGIPSAEAFGSASVAQAITGAGIASLEAFGSAQLNLAFTASSIASLEAFGVAAVSAGTIVFSAYGNWKALIDPGDYPAGAEFFFEAIIATSNANFPSYARLYNITDAAVVTDSEVQSVNTTDERVRSVALTLPSGAKEYRCERGGVAGATYYCYSADVLPKSG